MFSNVFIPLYRAIYVIQDVSVVMGLCYADVFPLSKIPCFNIQMVGLSLHMV